VSGGLVNTSRFRLTRGGNRLARKPTLPQGNHLPFDLGRQAQHRGGDPALDRPLEHQLLFGDVHTHPLRHTVLQHLQDLQGGARHTADFGEEHRIAACTVSISKRPTARSRQAIRPDAVSSTNWSGSSPWVVGIHKEPIALIILILSIG
jgi:hypothetical protein